MLSLSRRKHVTLRSDIFLIRYSMLANWCCHQMNRESMDIVANEDVGFSAFIQRV